MPLQYQKKVTRFGTLGTETMSVRLRPLNEEIKSYPPSQRDIANQVMSLGQMLRISNFADITIPGPTPDQVQKLSYDELKAAFPDHNFDDYVLTVEYGFTPDKDAPPLYPSDLADEMHRHGISEEQIQELIEWEKSVRES